MHPRDRLKKLTTAKEKVEFIKQVPVHPRDRLKKLAAAEEKVEFIKQVPVHPENRLKKLISEKVDFIKQVPKDRLKKQQNNRKSTLEVEWKIRKSKLPGIIFPN